jgi:GNAT superfamily N-acetyltransferase
VLDLHFFHPASVAEAHDLLATSPMPIDSLTQRRIRSESNLSEYFTSRRRRPEWVWGVRRAGDPAVLGVVGAFGADSVFLLDVFGLPEDPEVARALLARVTADVLATHDRVETVIFATPGVAVADEVLAPLVDPLRQAGWRLLVERRHYEFEPPPGLAADETVELTFEGLEDRDDARLAACIREIMRDTLDAHDQEVIEREGFDAAYAQSLEDLVADGVDRMHLAHRPAGEIVGLVSGVVLPNTRAVVDFVGVARDHRGHGYGRQLLAWQTRRLIAGGASVLIADTDNQNLPMAAAFAAVGWEQAETRIDLVTSSVEGRSGDA